jgi:hypothetical protein
VPPGAEIWGRENFGGLFLMAGVGALPPRGRAGVWPPGPRVWANALVPQAVSRLGQMPKALRLYAFGQFSAERCSVAEHRLVERPFKSPRFNDRGVGYTLP